MKILIVDDTSINRKVAISFIETHSLDFDVFEAESGEEALELLAMHDIDILLLDIIMPGIDGIETLKHIPSVTNYNVKVIMYSSISDSVALENSFKYGAVDFIHKPIEEIEFVARIKSVVRQKNLEDDTLRYVREIESQKAVITNTHFQLMQKEKMAGIGQLAAGMAHEINNPLGFITGNVSVLQDYVRAFKEVYDIFQKDMPDKEKLELVREKTKEGDFQYIFEDLDDLFDETKVGLQRVQNIINSLRNFSRIDTFESAHVYDLNQGIKDTLIISQSKYKYIAEVETSFDELPTIDAIGSQINQVILNLFINAVEAIKYSKRDELGKIRLSTYVEGEYVCFKVNDDGTGISEEDRSSIFNPFFTTKPIGDGMGLGLSVSYDIIVNKHYGKIDICGEEEKREDDLGGACFVVYLPITNPRLRYID